jgi:hypothetical protein
MYHIKKLCILPTYFIHVFRVILRLNRDHFLDVISEAGTEPS